MEGERQCGQQAALKWKTISQLSGRDDSIDITEECDVAKNRLGNDLIDTAENTTLG